VPASPWARIKEHKVLQWSLAYLGAALALAHGQELLAHNFHWPELVGHVLIGALIVGFPIAVALAWYHGHRGMTRFSAPEMTVVALLLVIAGVLLTVLVTVPEERSGSVSSAPAAPPTESASPAPAASVAVVPFTNLTGEAGKEYFCDGMAEELINELTKVPGLKVPARTSSFAYKGRNIDIRQIARDLGVATILEGSVRSAGERIRVTAQLVNAKSGYHIWSNTYNRDFGDVFKLQDEISAEIVEALKSSMKVQVPAVEARTPPTRDPEAYRLYLQARALAQIRPFIALPLLTQALAKDGQFGRAYALRAATRVNLANFGRPGPEALASVEQDAKRALDLDPTLSDAYIALAEINAWRGNWLDAETSFRKARQLEPGEASFRALHAVYVLISSGHMREAVAEMRGAYALAPDSAWINTVLAASYSLVGVDTDALRFANLAGELGGGDSPLLAVVKLWSALRSGQYQVAADLDWAFPNWETARQAARLDLATARAIHNEAYAALGEPGKRSAAARALRSLMEVPPEQPGGDKDNIWLPVMLGDVNFAFAFGNRWRQDPESRQRDGGCAQSHEATMHD
jgi:TolB-like protein